MRATLAGAAVAGVLALAGCGGEDERPDPAARLVPADALAYVHVDLADERLRELVGRSESVERLVDGLATLAGDGAGAWAGDEAALALLDSGGPAADTLLLVEIADAEAARRAVRDEGGVQAQIAGDFLAVGQAGVVEQAVALAGAEGGGLQRTVQGSLDAYVPEPGISRVLAAQSGLLGALGAALDDPRLRFVSLTADAEEDGLRVRLRRARRGTVEAATVEPRLVDRVPADATAYLGLADPSPLVDRLGLRGLELGELALWVQRGVPAPVVTAVAEVEDEAAARDAAGRALGTLAARMAGEDPAAAGGQIAQLEERRLPGGLTASVLSLAPGVELGVAVAGGELLVATDPAALVRARTEPEDRLRDADAFRRVTGDLPERTEAIAFADLAQLLTLGEQAGLTSGQAAGAARELRTIRALGAVAEREGSDTTAELFFEIP